MKKLRLLFVFLSFLLSCRNKQSSLPIIPEPLQVVTDHGNFQFDSNTTLVVSQLKIEPEEMYLQSRLENFLSKKLQLENAIPKNGKYILLQLTDSDAQVKNYYQLNVTDSAVTVFGTNSESIFWGIQSLVQLLGANSESLQIPSCRIYDYPRYSWRGMHLDVCRHFFTKEEVKKYIDLLALYKFNTFHWHLTDDQGWRIEMKKYPLLTQIGSVRKETVIGKPSDTARYDGTPYGGFYTRDDIKEVVAYAQQRHVTIVPEIEMPGHALAALAAYPQFSCCMEPLETGTTWGVFEDVYCPGNDSTFEFLQDILSEVCELFPGKYIHIGGDECQKNRWMLCEKCQRRIKNEHLKDESELQSYFIRRIEKFLNSKGKQIIGWDEILEGGLAPNAAVMSWRGTKGGIEAAKQKHDVVMSPGRPCYFDHYQSKNRETEPLAIGGYNPLDSVYLYEPAPNEMEQDEKKYILGAQGNVWTEYITDFSHVEYMSVPRMCALSEVLWTPASNKDFKNFVARLQKHVVLLDRMNMNYAKHFLNILSP